MKMRPSRLIWMVILSCMFHSITFVESKKLKQQKDIGIMSKNSFEQEEQHRMKYFDEYSSAEPDTAKKTSPNKKEKSKGKKKNLFQDSTSYGSEEIIKDKNYFKKKNRQNSNKKGENMDSKTSGELVQKGKRLKTLKNINKSTKEFLEFPSNRFKKRNVMNEAPRGSPDGKGNRFNASKEKRMKHNRKESNNLKGLPKTRRIQTNFDVSNLDDKSDESLVDDMRGDSGYCSTSSVYEEECSESVANPGPETNEELQQQEFVELKNVKYSKKFAHEKTSKTEKNKEDQNILKLHRKAENDPKNAKSVKRINRPHDQDEESSEEMMMPRRRLKLYEDDEG